MSFRDQAESAYSISVKSMEQVQGVLLDTKREELDRLLFAVYGAPTQEVVWNEGEITGTIDGLSFRGEYEVNPLNMSMPPYLVIRWRTVFDTWTQVDSLVTLGRLIAEGVIVPEAD